MLTFTKEITCGFLTRWKLRYELNTGKKIVNDYGKSIIGEGAGATINFTEKWWLFYSVFTVTVDGFPDDNKEHIQEWLDDILNIDID